MSKDILDYIDETDDEFDEILEDFDEELEADDAVEGELVELDDSELDNVMSEARAREITEAIRSAATVTYVLLAQAHESGAHKALGYATWAEYVQQEFEMSAQRSYQLLDLSRVTNEIEATVPEGTAVKITEAQARDIKRELPRVTEQIREAIEDGEDPTEAVERVVDEAREQKKSEEKAIEKKQKALEDAEEEGYRAGLEAAADAILEEAAEEESDVEVLGESNDLSPEESMNIYNFFNVLTGLGSLPEPDEFIKNLPNDRVSEVRDQIESATNWLNRFSTLFEIEFDESDDDERLF